jgi:Zn-finger nucleic acid-binding protein
MIAPFEHLSWPSVYNTGMKCPSCKTTDLTAADLESGLTAHVCESCQGHWISGRGYHDWLDRHGATLAEKTYDGPDIVIADTQNAKLCPECARILLRYKVGRGTDFTLEHCGACNGVWLDRGEWDALKVRNLHDEINAILTVPWQTRARLEERRRNLDQIYAARFGADYDELKRIRTWVDGHPERDRVLAFLTDPDPYSV